MTKSQGAPGLHSNALLILAAAIAALYFAREIFVPLAFALTLGLLLTPITGWFQKLRLGRVAAALLSLALVIGIAGGLAWIIVGQLLDVANQLPNYRDNIHAKIESLGAPGKGALARAAQSIKEITNELSAPPPPVRSGSRTGGRVPTPVTIIHEPASRLQYLRDTFRQFSPAIGQGFIVLVFTAFGLIAREDLRNRILRLAGLSQLSVMTQAFDDATQRVSRYLLLQLVVNGCFGTLFAAGLSLLGIPYAALWGVVAGLLRFVPYVGTPIAALLPITLSLAVFTGWGKPLAIFGVFLALEIVTANIVEPVVYGTQTGVSSLAILVAAVFWAMLWGPAGLVLSTPLTVCLVVMGRYVPQLSFLHVLLGDEEVLAMEAQFYQRLLAMDQAEARELVDVFLKSHTLLELYDNVIVPALTMAEQDRHKGAMDPAREEFVFLSISEMVAEFSVHARAAGQQKPPMPGRIFCVPTNDAGDEIAAAMLAQVLHQAGFAVVALPAAPTFHDLRTFLQPEQGDVLCVSALPPFAFARARELSRNIRAGFANIPLIVGIWGFGGDPVEALERFDEPGPNHVTTSFAGTLELLQNRVRDMQHQPA